LLKYVAVNAGLTTSSLTQSMAKTHVIRHKHVPVPGSLFIYGNTGMAWMDRGVRQPPGMALLGHAGGTAGYRAFVGFDKKQRRGVVVLSTSGTLAPNEAIGWLLLQREPLSLDGMNTVMLYGAEIVGIGTALEVDPESGLLRITKVVASSPAERAGLMAGEIIQSIGGVSTFGKSLPDCTQLIRGPAGTKVKLDLVDAEGQSITVELTRAKLHLGG
jgi:hypothetical protein